MAHMINTTRKASMKSEQITNVEQFLRMSPDIMAISRFDGTLEYFNEVWEKTFGYTKEEIKEKQIWGIAHPDDLKIVESELKQLAAGKTKSVNIEIRMICKNGSIKHIAWSGNTDHISGLIYGVGRDITNIIQKNNALIDSEQNFKFLSENSFEGILITTDGIAQLANQAYAEMFGYENQDEIVGKHYEEFVADNELKKVKKIVNENFTGTYESRGKTKDGNYFSVEVRVKIMEYKGKQSRVISIRSIEDKKLAEQELDKTELRFKSVFENNTVGVLLTNLQGKFVNVNEQLLSRLQYSREEFFTLSMNDILHKSEHEDAKQVFSDLLQNNSHTIQKERKFKCKNGRTAWSKCTSNVLTMQDGDQFIISFIEDIEQQKKHENLLFESNEKFRAVYESSPMGIIVFKKPGIILDANPAFAEMIGYDLGDIIGRNVLDFSHPSDVSRGEKLLEKVYSKELNMCTYEKRYVRKDKSIFWAQKIVSKMNVSSDEVITIALIENIDRKKRTEETLESKNKELLHINTELEHFAYVASHDLQEPLRTITSFIQILNKRYQNILDEDGRQFMGFVVEGAKRMQNLIRDLLEYSRINRFNTAYEEVDLNDVYQTVNRILKEKIDMNDAIVLAEHLPIVHGNKLQLTQIFQNLVDNAIKFRGKKKPEITITVEDQNDKWLFTFRDNGIGISNEYYQRIFIIFQRLHTHEEYTGTGIGLAICKKIVERHGGEIWLDSKVNKGTTFHFTIAKNLTAPMV